MTTWVKDDNGNRCSVEYFGSQEAAHAALDSLKNCKNCTNCSYCSYCSGCSDKKEEKGEFVPPPIPKIENINQKVYAAVSQPNALDMDDWHTCDTTHCRAGWVTTLAGEAGKALEDFFGTALAAQLIYRESGSPIHAYPLNTQGY